MAQQIRVKELRQPIQCSANLPPRKSGDVASFSCSNANLSIRYVEPDSHYSSLHNKEKARRCADEANVDQKIIFLQFVSACLSEKSRSQAPLESRGRGNSVGPHPTNGWHRTEMTSSRTKRRHSPVWQAHSPGSHNRSTPAFSILHRGNLTRRIGRAILPQTRQRPSWIRDFRLDGPKKCTRSPRIHQNSLSASLPKSSYLRVGPRNGDRGNSRIYDKRVCDK